jgi:cysteine desulfurase
MHAPVYLDHHATTPVDPRVLTAMLPFFGLSFGNAASRSHSYGWAAEKAVEHARKRVAHLAGAQPREIVFTSGATESNNLAIKGAAEANPARNHFITMATEHRAVLDPLRHLERQGSRLTVLAPQPDGLLDLDGLRRAILPETLLVSVMFANNEIGVLQPVAEIGSICRERGVLFHCDAAQAFGKVPVDANALQIDLMSASAHKLYGPKGVGFLYVRRGAPRFQLAAQMDGGGHENGLRSGTLNVPAIVGFGEACAVCSREMPEEAARLAALRDQLLARLTAALDGVTVNGSLAHRLPGNLHLSFAGVDAESLLMAMPDVALSTGSACSSGTPEPSHVLRALGVTDPLAHSSIRIGLGRFNTEQELDYAAHRLIESVKKLRALSPATFL